MKKSNDENKKRLSSNREVIDIKEFMLLKSDKQDELIKDTLNKMYEGEIEVNNTYIEKVLNVAFETKDVEVYLPESLRVSKRGNKLIFDFHKKANIVLFLLFSLGFLFAGGFATYTGVQYLRASQLNIDTNGDGVPDLNVDLDDDGICDVNCDTDKDHKPDVNIDYRGNRKPTFNVKLEDGSIFNPMNQDNDKDGICDINCDTNSDGWPDINIDLDGDGKPDINVDVDHDGKPDVNIDYNGDGTPDVNIDEDNDGICDKNCISNLIHNKNSELEIDLDDDGICDVNCDTNNDGKPDLNIDYNGSKKPTFNVKEKDGSISNPMNQDNDKDGICDVNCDIDDDGWPDTNIDLNKDGKPDLNVDVDHDGWPDTNIDTDGDSKPDLNIDEDGDGKCDKNCISNLVNNKPGELDIDKDHDGKCDVNCDTNGDGKPDKNIDYGNSKEPIFNKNDGTNKTNQKDNNGVCVLNCDVDDDGWPDTNIDLNADGKPDINIDTNHDGQPDINIDTDKDGKPDINIDEDGDGKCDRNCAYIVDTDGKGMFTQGDGTVNLDTASLIVTFDNGNNVVLSNIYPDDQEGDVNKKIPDLKFTIQNTTSKTLKYHLSWIELFNSFTSTNFWYKVTSTNGGLNQTWETAPKENGVFASDITIPAYSSQDYTISFTLHGIGSEQNEDQGKTFKGRVSVQLIETS